MRASASVKTLETPRLDPELESLAAQRVGEAFGHDPRGRATEGEERDELAGASAQAALAPDDVDERVAEHGVHLHAGEIVAAQDQQLAEQVVEPALDAADHEDPARLPGDGRAERELEIGRVLLGRMAFCPVAQLRERPRRDRVEVADCELDLQAEREGVVGSAVRGDHSRAGGYRLARATAGRRAPGDDHDRVGHAGSLTSHGAFRSAGGRRCRTGTSRPRAGGSSSSSRGTSCRCACSRPSRPGGSWPSSSGR